MSEGRVNGYDCPDCGGTTWTREVDAGVTPATLGCQATRGCWGAARSRGYRVPLNHPEPLLEWFRSGRAMARRIDREYPGMFKHWKAGGLFLRHARPRPETPEEGSLG